VFISGLRLSFLGQQVLCRYRAASKLARLYLNTRWRWTPYENIAAHVPPQGLILDLGSGHGLLSLAMSLSEPGRTIRGVDHEPTRVELAREAAAGQANVEFAIGGLLEAVTDESLSGRVAGIVIMDAIHYLDYDEQEVLLSGARKALRPGGVLLIRDVDASAGKSFIVNRLYEKAMTGLGFTRADRLNFRSNDEWLQVLAKAGFEAASTPCNRFPFADLLFACRRPAVQAALAA
jgi:SAM-dependent methyltransferase